MFWGSLFALLVIGSVELKLQEKFTDQTAKQLKITNRLSRFSLPWDIVFAHEYRLIILPQENLAVSRVSGWNDHIYLLSLIITNALTIIVVLCVLQMFIHSSKTFKNKEKRTYNAIIQRRRYIYFFRPQPILNNIKRYKGSFNDLMVP